MKKMRVMSMVPVSHSSETTDRNYTYEWAILARVYVTVKPFQISVR